MQNDVGTPPKQGRAVTLRSPAHAALEYDISGSERAGLEKEAFNHVANKCIYIYIYIYLHTLYLYR